MDKSSNHKVFDNSTLKNTPFKSCRQQIDIVIESVNGYINALSSVVLPEDMRL